MSTLLNSITQPGGLTILQKPASSKIHDPILKRRRHAYSHEERRYIRSLLPLDTLPPSLRPTSKNRRPPTVYFGWVINETAKARLLETAHQYPECLVLEEVTQGSEDDECLELRCPPGDHTHVRESTTMDQAAELVLREIGVSTYGKTFVDAVLTADESLAFCLTLYTNYELDRTPPSKDDIKRIRERLGLRGKPQWWPDSHFQWFD